MGDGLWVDILVVISGGIGICCLLAFCAQPLRSAIISLFAIIYQPLLQIRDACRSLLQSVQSWLLAQVAEESSRPGEGPVYFAIGSVFYTLLTALFLLCDFGVIILTAEAMGMDKAAFELPVGTSTLVAGTVVSGGLFWGAIVLDLLGVTHLAPWNKALSERRRSMLMRLAVLSIFLCLVILACMAVWRWDSLCQSFISEAHAAPPDRGLVPAQEIAMEISGGAGVDASTSQGPVLSATSKTVLLCTIVGIALLSLTSSVPSAWGMATLCKFLVLLVISAVVLPPLSAAAFLTWLATGLIDGIARAVQMILDVPIHIGNSILGLFRRRASVSPTRQEGPTNSEPSRDSAPQQDHEADPGFDPFRRRRG